MVRNRSPPDSSPRARATVQSHLAHRYLMAPCPAPRSIGRSHCDDVFLDREAWRIFVSDERRQYARLIKRVSGSDIPRPIIDGVLMTSLKAPSPNRQEGKLPGFGDLYCFFGTRREAVWIAWLRLAAYSTGENLEYPWIWLISEPASGTLSQR